MRYINAYATGGDVQTAFENETLGKPYVAYIESEGKLDWNSKSAGNTMTLLYETEEMDDQGRFKLFSTKWDGENDDSEEMPFKTITYNGMDLLEECGIEEEEDPIYGNPLKVYYINYDFFGEEPNERVDIVFQFKDGWDYIPSFTFGQAALAPDSTVEIPSFIWDIGEYAFWASTNYRGTIDFVLNEGLDTIGGRAFEALSFAASALTIPSTVTFIDTNAFNVDGYENREFTYYVLPTTPPELDNEECSTFGNLGVLEDDNVTFVYPSGSTSAYAATNWAYIAECPCQDWEKWGYSSWEDCRCNEYGDNCPEEEEEEPGE